MISLVDVKKTFDDITAVDGISIEISQGHSLGLLEPNGAGKTTIILPSLMRPLSRLSPVSWAVLALEGAIWRGFSLGELLVPYTILLAIGFAGIAIGTYRLGKT